MNVMKHFVEFDRGTSNLAMRVIVFAVVASAHLTVFSVWSTQADKKFVTSKELSVSFSIAAEAPQTAIASTRKYAPAPLPEQLAAPATSVPAEQTAAMAAHSPAPTASVVAATEPDYKASYLNNPPPAYPMLARRNGLQGRVVLNVEVLASGVCGQINIQTSSGYAMLDDAAVQTVKTWRFLPASQAGRALDKWFMIPIQFSLKDNKA